MRRQHGNSKKIGVRELVEFTLRTGDLNARANSNNTALEGAIIHRRLQKQRGANYQKEYYLERELTLADRPFLIHGRADGVILDTDNPLIEEIKTSDAPFEELSENTLTLYWAQAQIYAYILMTDEDLDAVTLQLTYFQRPTETVTQTTHHYTQQEATAFF